MKLPEDKIGQEISVGSFIVYGHALGRSAGLRLGRVLEISKGKPGPFDKGWSIKVIGIEDNEYWDKPPEACQRVGTLKFPERIVVLNKRKFPKNLKKILDEYEWKNK